jgi:hypothetical protein
MFRQSPICEECGRNEAISFRFFPSGSDSSKGEWKFVCGCTAKSDGYYILINDFFASPPATVDCLAHMNDKKWMNWNDFMCMMERFRKATNSFGAP